MSEANIRVRIVYPSQGIKESRAHGFKRESSISMRPEQQCASCKERGRGHVGGEERRSLNQGKGKTNPSAGSGLALSKVEWAKNQQESAVLRVSDISRSIQESLRLRKTLRV